MNVYIIGNPLVIGDSLPILIKPKLRTTFEQFDFVEIDPTENFIPEDGSIIIDSVVGIDSVTWFDSLAAFAQTKSVSAHDYDLGFHLRFLQKLGKLPSIRIIGIPYELAQSQAERHVIDILVAQGFTANESSESESRTTYKDHTPG
jgi:hypothetical protein